MAIFSPLFVFERKHLNCRQKTPVPVSRDRRLSTTQQGLHIYFPCSKWRNRDLRLNGYLANPTPVNFRLKNDTFIFHDTTRLPTHGHDHLRSRIHRTAVFPMCTRVSKPRPRMHGHIIRCEHVFLRSKPQSSTGPAEGSGCRKHHLVFESKPLSSHEPPSAKEPRQTKTTRHMILRPIYRRAEQNRTPLKQYIA